MWRSWIWVLIYSAFQVDACQDRNRCSKEDGNVWRYESSCKSSVMCSTCLTSSLTSSLFNCDTSSDGACYYLTLPQAFGDGCNLKGTYENMISYNASYEEAASTYWYPAKRFVKYGAYRSTVWGSLYGTIVEEKVNASDVDFSKDCLVVTNGTDRVIPEDCGAKHRHNCSLTKSDRRQFCSSDCAYCTGSHTCVAKRSGCPRNSRGTSRYKRYPFNPCSGCLRRADNCPSNVNMVLSFRKKLYLTIYSPSCLYNKGDPDYIYCFTDASDQLRKRVNITLVNKNQEYPYPSPQNYLVFRLDLEDYLGQYWCETVGHLEGNVKIKSNRIIASKVSVTNEFAVRLKIRDICGRISCPPASELDLLLDDIKSPIERRKFGKVRLMKVNNFFAKSYADITIHVSTLRRTSQVEEDFRNLDKILLELPENVTVVSARSFDRCLPEVAKNLTWPSARRFQTVLPNELCLQESGSLVTRFCYGDFVSGLQWGRVQGSCSVETSNYTEETLLLQTFLTQEVSQTVMQNVSEIVRSSNLTLVDLYIVSQLLEKSTELPANNSVLDVSFSVVSGLLKKDWGLLYSAQEEFNLTDSFLRNCELIALNYTGGDNHSSVTMQKDNVIYHSFNPLLDNSSGFVLYKNRSVRNLPAVQGEGFELVEDVTNVKLAVYISAEDIAAITEKQLWNVSAVFVIFLNGNFFPSNTSMEVDLVVNANLHNYEDYLQDPIHIMVNSESGRDPLCAFWDYGNVQDPKRGDWSSEGSLFEGTFRGHANLQMCSYTHITHLALLVMKEEDGAVLEGVNDSILTLMTAVGSVLSLFGINGIFLTSCMFKYWRDKAGTQILLHLSFATLLEIVFMYLNGIKLFDCVISGCILQYVIISKFAWMLIYAFCQYLRFVKVFKLMPDNFLAKSIVFGWGFGIIPTLGVALSNPSTYFRESFCYPNGAYLYVGLYLPIAIVVLVNCVVFCKIMCEITKGHLDQFHSASLRIQQIKLAILLFSVLGIPWLFGMMSNVVPWNWLKVVCVYIFTITAILQGFLMFLFYVIFNKETRVSWQRALFYDKEQYKIFSTPKSHSVSSVM